MPLPSPVPMSLRAKPLDVLAAWPCDRPVMTLLSVRGHERWGRWSILASPVGFLRCGERTTWIGDPVDAPMPLRFTHDTPSDLAAILSHTMPSPADTPPPPLLPVPASFPFRGGWIGYLSYDLGRQFEPTACSTPSAIDDRGWPDCELAWCPNALVFDHHEARWWRIGNPPLAFPDRSLQSGELSGEHRSVDVGSLLANVDPDDYRLTIRRAIEFIAAGDIFQANITQRHTARFHGSIRQLAIAALRESGAWYGAHLEFPAGRTLTSLSPELFLHLNGASRQIVTRPIKGTRPAGEPICNLRDSAKDTAELHMIIDLMRNDLGRVCVPGSIQVTTARAIESHPTVHHGVGEVVGTLRNDVSVTDLLTATFPPGSVTGAPKIRAMQIIDELECTRRGPYCGAIGYLSCCGTLTLNVAIRTLLTTRPTADQHSLLDYSAGGGIVADSTPEAELRESLDKVEVLRRALRALAGDPASG